MTLNSFTFLKSANCKIKSSFSYKLKERKKPNTIKNVYILEQNMMSCLSASSCMKKTDEAKKLAEASCGTCMNTDKKPGFLDFCMH